jgi:hypothetical protein
MDWLGIIVTIIIGFIGILLGYFFFIKEIQKKIEYEIKSFTLIPEEISEKISQAHSLKILYGREGDFEDVKILTSSIIKIENTGWKEIVKNNIAPDDPLRIFVKDKFKLYFAKELDRKGSANNFDIKSHNERYVDISFAHLNRGDGIKIQVYHSGSSNDAVEIHGTVIGGPKVKEKPKWKKNIGKILIVGIVSFSISVLILYFMFPLMIQSLLGTTEGLLSLVVLFVIGIVFFIVALTMAGTDRIYEYLAKRMKKTEW